MIFEKILMCFAFIAIIWELYKAFNKRIIQTYLDNPLKSPYRKWEKRIARAYAIISLVGLFSIAWQYWLILNLLSIVTAFTIHLSTQYKQQQLAIRLDTIISIILLITIIFITLNTTYYV